jgi:3D (Asp-Asp-Asp) domain-containing protein
MTRIALALIVTAAGITTVVHRHHRTPAPAASAQLASVLPLRASRSRERQPLPGVKPQPSRGKARQHPLPIPRQRDLRLVSGLSDVTMYCSTGNRNAAGRWPRIGDVAVIDRAIKFGTRLLIAGRTYIVEDWIGSGSQFDIFGGDDEGCEQRALAFGRQRLHVEVER